MGKVVDFKQASMGKGHQRKEAKVRKIRDSFRSARESWQGESRTTSSLKKLLQGKKSGKKK